VSVGRAFCHAGPSAWNALPDFKKTMYFLCLSLDASVNISASTPSAFEVILQLTRYTSYLLTSIDNDVVGVDVVVVVDVVDEAER